MATATKTVLGAIYKIIVVNILYFLQCDDNGLECKLNSLSLLLGYVASFEFCSCHIQDHGQKGSQCIALHVTLQLIYQLRVKCEIIQSREEYVILVFNVICHIFGIKSEIITTCFLSWETCSSEYSVVVSHAIPQSVT